MVSSDDIIEEFLFEETTIPAPLGRPHNKKFDILALFQLGVWCKINQGALK